MIGNLARLTEARLTALQADPASTPAFLYGEDAVATQAAQPGLLRRLLGAKPPPPPPAVAAPLAEADAIDLDKAWHGLHFLLTGTAWEGEFPANFLVSGGTPVGDVDVGYGPARAFAPAEVRRLGEFLDGLDEATLRARYEPSRLAEAEIYPDLIWTRDDEREENWEYLLDAFTRARAFVRETADRGLALLAYIN
jgi:hypothetical protein